MDISYVALNSIFLPTSLPHIFCYCHIVGGKCQVDIIVNVALNFCCLYFPPHITATHLLLLSHCRR